MAVTLELDRTLLFGVKGMYGWACYVCVFVVLGFLFFDSPIRRHHARMIPWASVGGILKRYYQLKDE